MLSLGYKKAKICIDDNYGLMNIHELLKKITIIFRTFPQKRLMYQVAYRTRE